jgi:GNAT superfamily N-acetyltransferase
MKEFQKITIIDLPGEHEELYFHCLEEWSEEMKEAGDHKKHWYEKMKEKGIRVKLSLDEHGTIGGMIQYCPVEHTHVSGEELYFIYCIWVHGYKQGRGDFRKKGMGTALLKAAEEDVKARGARGIAAWGVSLPVFMRASWFKKQGYKKADKDGVSVLLWKPFVPGAEPPSWIRQNKKPAKVPGRVTVTVFYTGWCPAQNIVFERAKRAASQFGEKVVFNDINCFDREVFLEWGIADGLYIDGKMVNTGPPPSYEKIRKLIAKQVKKLKNGNS